MVNAGTFLWGKRELCSSRIEQSYDIRDQCWKHSRGNESDYFSSKISATAGIRISVIHIYEDAIARGIKINGEKD